MKVLLTGAFGNIGSHALAALLAARHQVCCLDLPDRANRRAAKALGGRAEVLWGDVRDDVAVRAAMEGVDAVVHLAAVIPPRALEEPAYARAVNVEGTRQVLAAARQQAKPPRFVFASSLDVHGRTQQAPPPRHVDDALVRTDVYTEHKIEGERHVRESGLDWCILRFADVPVLGLRDPHPIMFEIGLHNRIEALHADDAGLALARALASPAVWGKVLFVGGGKSCQLTYGDYLARLMRAMGLPPLPPEAFSTADYVTDWLDTAESQRLLDYQRHTFDDIVAAIAARLGWRRPLVPVAAPFVRRSLLRLSPYWRARAR
jgi:nucleoside-diphosphate-sugar epimerase